MKTFFRIVTASVLFAAAGAVTTLANDAMTEMLRPLKGSEFDQAFLAQMIQHHQQGIEMAKLASHHAQSAGVQEFAAKTAKMQQEDIAEMQRMLGGESKSRGRMHDPSMEKMHKETMAKLEAAQGTAFDRLFADEMLKHHQMGLEMAQLGAAQGSRDDVRSFAEKTVKQQKSESEELQNLK